MIIEAPIDLQPLRRDWEVVEESISRVLAAVSLIGFWTCEDGCIEVRKLRISRDVGDKSLRLLQGRKKRKKA